MATVAIWACGDSDPTPATGCTPGEKSSCVGPSSCQGSRLCGGDHVFGDCICDSTVDSSTQPDASEAGVDATLDDVQVVDAADSATVDAADAWVEPDCSTPLNLDAGTSPLGQSLSVGAIYGVAVDHCHNDSAVIVGKLGNNSTDFYVRKVDSSGALLWKVDLPTNAFANAVAVDAAGMVYVAAGTYATINPGAGSIGPGAFVVKYDSTGAFQWQYGAFHNTVFTALAVKSNGNVVIVGRLDASDDYGGGVVTSNGQSDALLVEVTSGKKLVRAVSWGDSLYQDIEALSLDPSGNAFISGSFAGSIDFGGGKMTAQTGTDVFVAKLDPSAAYLHQLDTKVDSASAFLRVAADTQGKVYVAGRTVTTKMNLGGGDLTPTGPNPFIVAGYLDASLGHVWSNIYGDSKLGESAFAVTVDPTGAAAITGFYYDNLDMGLGLLPAGPGPFVARLDATGKTLASWGGGQGKADYAMGWAIDYVTWPDFIIGGMCFQSVALPSGKVSCSTNQDAFFARLKP